jgi:hypothetical protein
MSIALANPARNKFSPYHRKKANRETPNAKRET